MPKAAVPVTVLSGFLGAGKTTLLQRILSNTEGLKIAVIVNDMAEVNIDSARVGHTMVHRPAELVELHNGCICCTLRKDLLEEVGRLARLGCFDAVIIESTGVSEPMEVAETFTFPLHAASNPLADVATEDAHALLGDIARLDLMVTLVDACNFWQDFESIERLRKRHGENVAEEDDRNVVQLLVDQIEFADLVLLNKADLVNEEQLHRIAGAVRALNSACEIITCIRGDVPISKLINTSKFSMVNAIRAPGWLKSLKEEKTPETEHYGISSFVYRARRPFDPARFATWASRHWVFADTEREDESGEEEEEEEEQPEIDDVQDPDNVAGGGQPQQGAIIGGEIMKGAKLSSQQRRCKDALAACRAHFGNVLRSKGFVWLASRPRLYGDWNQVGTLAEIDNGGPWFAELDESAWPDGPEEQALIRREFEAPHGDRRQELVFIGQSLNREAISVSLDACLLTDEELQRYEATWMLGPAKLMAVFPDPMLPWETPPASPAEKAPEQTEETLAKRARTN